MKDKLLLNICFTRFKVFGGAVGTASEHQALHLCEYSFNNKLMHDKNKFSIDFRIFSNFAICQASEHCLIAKGVFSKK